MFERFRLGNGALRPALRAELEAEGLVLAEEGLRGSIRYERFKAPGKRFYGKVSGERLGLGLSETRLVVYCRSGTVELIDSELSSPRFEMVEIALEGDDSLAIRIDYDRSQEAKAAAISGVITIRATTPNAAVIVEEVNARLRRSARDSSLN
jgi:hypothetical protein